MASRVRPDQRWEAGAGAGNGQPGSSARKGRSLAADQLTSHVLVETS
jgi:hypothetical protein